MAMNQLHPGAKWVFRLRGYAIAVFLLIFFSWMLFPILGIADSLIFKNGFAALFLIAIIGIFLYIVAVIIVGEIYARMTYNRWFYEFGPTNLKLERGIIWKRYSNVPYERVQNVDIQRGILARMFGFSSVHIQTAGYSYSPRGGIGSEGYLPAIEMDKAEEIRDFLMKKISKRHGQGL
ncbi:MAG: PH domain-containing protein [Candidatus Pacearchaeota archaeon]